MKRKIQSVEVSYFVHSTEDGSVIEEAVRGCFGDLGEPEREELEGHFGNSIIRVRHHVTGEAAADAMAALVSKMDQALKKKVAGEMRLHLDEHYAFYIRLHKQQLIRGRLELADSDPVRVRVKPRAFTLEAGAEPFFLGLLS